MPVCASLLSVLYDKTGVSFKPESLLKCIHGSLPLRCCQLLVFAGVDVRVVEVILSERAHRHCRHFPEVVGNIVRGKVAHLTERHMFVLLAVHQMSGKECSVNAGAAVDNHGRFPRACRMAVAASPKPARSASMSAFGIAS